MTRQALGRGLDALLPTGPTEVPSPAGQNALREIPIEDIHANPRQPRRTFDEGSIAELAVSVAELGVLQPLLVRDTLGGYELIAGERRLRAAGQAGLASVPAIVVETDERGALERALVENIHREDLNPIEEAAALRQLMDEGGLTQEALGERIGRNRVTIANSLRLLELPVPVQRFLAERRLTAAHGRALLALQGNPFLERLARRAADEGWSTRETEEHVRRYRAMSGLSPASSRSKPARPAIAVDTQRKLSDRLQTRVRVQVGERKGKIVIDFVSQEELARLTGLILGDAPETQNVIPG
ncbi:MAG TPA: ParB/RepB/Spo0J family partition protein [Actinomycetota bacterium]|nr:ParB/RepB/Spo0J family partition protein [Actinomycetota bacterium]